MWSLSRLTLDAGAGDLFWPLIVRGVSLGIIFIPLTSASLAELEPREIPQGTGMFNLTRQLGGSLGIAIVATMLSRFTFEAKSQLTQHVVTIGTDAQARLEFISPGHGGAGDEPRGRPISRR